VTRSTPTDNQLYVSNAFMTTAAWTALPSAAALALGATLAVLSGTAWAVVGSAWGRFVLIDP